MKRAQGSEKVDLDRGTGLEMGTDLDMGTDLAMNVDAGARPGSEGDGPSSGEPCGRCGNELSVIRIMVDGNTLLMESCDGCDARRWQLAGERIDLQKALDQVGEHAGRRR